MRPRRIAAAAACAVVAVLGLAGPASAAYTVTPSFALGLSFGLADPAGTPPGVNRDDCKLTAAKPRPVILVHGTTENRLANWSGLGPRLANEGFCVFAPNYGYYNGIPALTNIESSAAQLGAYVDQVLAKYPGVTKVDIVGHSQGGMMPRYYIKFLGGQDKVNRLIGIAPSNNGTTLSGLANLAKVFGLTGAVEAIGPAFAQQIVGSAFLQNLNAGDPTPGAVKYDVLVTNGDQVVTPYRSAFIAGASAWTAQSGCLLEASEHLQISYSRRVHTKVMNLLDGRNRTLPCDLVLPYV
jgi:triacylglycerol esterase/lipase EstA (alpha/beta hydrolase family)